MDEVVETSIYAEKEACGFWRLQTNDIAVSEIMSKRSKQVRSPWIIVGRGLTLNDPMIYRRQYSSSTKARLGLERILSKIAVEYDELLPVDIGKGWIAQPLSSKNKGVNCCHSSPIFHTSKELN